MLSLSFIVLLAVGNFALGFLAALVLAGTVAHHDEHEFPAAYDEHRAASEAADRAWPSATVAKRAPWAVLGSEPSITT